MKLEEANNLFLFIQIGHYLCNLTPRVIVKNKNLMFVSYSTVLQLGSLKVSENHGPRNHGLSFNRAIQRRP